MRIFEKYGVSEYLLQANQHMATKLKVLLKAGVVLIFAQDLDVGKFFYQILIFIWIWNFISNLFFLGESQITGSNKSFRKGK